MTPSPVAFNAALVGSNGWKIDIGVLTIGFTKYVGEVS